MEVDPPRRLQATDDLSAFDCNEAVMNDWLTQRAFTAEKTKTAAVYVICEHNTNIVRGYYTLSMAALHREDKRLIRRLRHNMPSDIPVALLGRLAIDIQCQHQQLGTRLLAHALYQASLASALVGAVALVVDTLNDDVKDFYLANGFSSTGIDGRLYASLLEK